METVAAVAAREDGSVKHGLNRELNGKHLGNHLLESAVLLAVRSAYRLLRKVRRQMRGNGMSLGHRWKRNIVRKKKP